MGRGPPPTPHVLALPWLLLILLPNVNAEGRKSGSSETVGCFVCHSFNNSNPRCMDPYSPSEDAYVPRCESGINGRVGTFPAHYCIKISGVSVVTGYQRTVRACSITTMHDQCGLLEFDGEQYKGCLTSCNKNGCNHGDRVSRAGLLWWVLYLCVTAAVAGSGIRH